MNHFSIFNTFYSNIIFDKASTSQKENLYFYFEDLNTWKNISDEYRAERHYVVDQITHQLKKAFSDIKIYSTLLMDIPPLPQQLSSLHIQFSQIKCIEINSPIDLKLIELTHCYQLENVSIHTQDTDTITIKYPDHFLKRIDVDPITKGPFSVKENKRMDDIWRGQEMSSISEGLDNAKKIVKDRMDLFVNSKLKMPLWASQFTKGSKPLIFHTKGLLDQQYASIPDTATLNYSDDFFKKTDANHTISHPPSTISHPPSIKKNNTIENTWLAQQGNPIPGGFDNAKESFNDRFDHFVKSKLGMLLWASDLRGGGKKVTLQVNCLPPRQHKAISALASLKDRYQPIALHEKNILVRSAFLEYLSPRVALEKKIIAQNDLNSHDSVMNCEQFILYTLIATGAISHSDAQIALFSTSEGNFDHFYYFLGLDKAIERQATSEDIMAIKQGGASLIFEKDSAGRVSHMGMYSKGEIYELGFGTEEEHYRVLTASIEDYIQYIGERKKRPFFTPLSVFNRERIVDVKNAILEKNYLSSQPLLFFDSPLREEMAKRTTLYRPEEHTTDPLLLYKF